MARASPVFAGEPAPTRTALQLNFAQTGRIQSSSTTGFCGSGRNPGNGWSFGGPGTGIGGNSGAPGWLSYALGGVLGVICGYGVGVGVPGAPGTGVASRGGVLAASAMGRPASSTARIAPNISNLLSGTFLQATPKSKLSPVRLPFKHARLNDITVICLIRTKETP